MVSASHSYFMLILRVYKATFDEAKFQRVLTKLYSKLFQLEDQKYLEPKFSYALKDLAEDYDIYEKLDAVPNESILNGGLSQLDAQSAVSS